MLSFYAPYVCDSCRTPFQAVIDAYVHREAIQTRTPPPTKCPKCGAEARYDGSMEAFAAACEKVEPKRERSVPDPGGPTIERHSAQDGTRLVLVGELATTLRWRSAMDGLDGALTLDLTRSTAVAAGGVAPLLLALRAAAPTLKAVTVHGAPLQLAVALRMDPIHQLSITSVVIEGDCAKCTTVRRAPVDVVNGRWEEPLSRGVTCPKCGERLAVGKTLDDVPQRSFPIGMLLAGSAALAAVALVLVLAGLVMAGIGGTTREEDPIVADTPAVERLVIGPDTVSAAGHGGPSPTRLEADTAARDKALGLLISALSREIGTRRGLSTGAIDVSHDQVQEFVTAVPEAGGAPLEQKVTEGEAGIEVDARYGFARAVFDRVAASYAEEKTWGGLTLVRMFPPAPGLKVVASEVEGIEPGVRLLRVGEAPADDPSALPPAAGAQLVVQDADGTERPVTLP
ncbi:MAG: zinc ribbon domain-containing protein [Myxococcota bacterium]